MQHSITIGANRLGFQQCNKPIHLAVLDGCLAVLEQDGQRIQYVRLDGTIIKYLGENILKDPRCMVVDKDGKIYVCDVQHKSIVVFDKDGNLYKMIPCKCRTPVDIAHDATYKRLLITDGHLHCVFQCTLKDEKVTLFVGEYGFQQGQFRHPHGLVVDDQDNVIVCDHENRRIQKFGPDAKHIATIPLSTFPMFMHQNLQTLLLYVNSYRLSTNFVTIYTLEVIKQDKVIHSCTIPALNDANGMVTVDDKLYICDTAKNCIQGYELSLLQRSNQKVLADEQ